MLPLLHLVVADTDNPRSLAWVARTMRDRFVKLSRHDPLWAHEMAQSLPHPEDWPLDAMATPDDAGGHTALIGALNDCSAQALALSDALGRRLFSHVGAVDRAVWQ